MKNKLLYLFAALIMFGAVYSCSDKDNLMGNGENQNNGENRDNALQVRGGMVLFGNTTTPDCYAFEKNRKIRVYYNHYNLNTTYEFLQGVYQSPDDEDIDTKWTDLEWAPNPGDDKIKSIYLEDIKAPNSDDKYFFTATTYPEPNVANQTYNMYEVKSDQTSAASYIESDFLAARAVFSDKTWETGGIRFHFRHLLSRLVVKVILPQGTTADGYFPSPTTVSSSAAIKDKHTQYSVVYNNQIADAGLFTVNTETGVRSDIKMYKEGVETVTISTGSAAMHTFSAILPTQSTVSSGELLNFLIGGKEYIYTPPAANTVVLQQEHITTIQLIMLSGPGNQKLLLDKVTITPWITDRAEVGDLITD